MHLFTHDCAAIARVTFQTRFDAPCCARTLLCAERYEEMSAAEAAASALWPARSARRMMGRESMEVARRGIIIVVVVAKWKWKWKWKRCGLHK